jgi:O-methyltransferase domain/Dimerisation domain
MDTLSTTAQTQLRHLIDSYRVSQAICVAAELGLADLLTDGPRHYEDLARASGTNPQALFRLLRALASVDVFARLDGERFALNPLAECLRSGVAGSLHAWAVQSDQLRRAWTDLRHSVATGQTAFDHLHGMSVWEYRERHPDEGRMFQIAMTATTLLVVRSVLEAYDFSRFGTVADIGGGRGTLLQAILEVNPQLRGMLFDVPAAIREAAAQFERSGLSGRCRLLEGTFFESVPEGADAYVLSRVLHDWTDAQAIQILKTTRRAMTNGAVLLLVERVLDSQHPSPEATLTDIHMLVMTGGRERTTEEFQELLAASGFELMRVIPTGSAVHVVEGVAV